MSAQPVEVVCESYISHVTIHARGARITREVILPSTLPQGAIVLKIEGLPLLMEPNSVRASVLSDERQLIAVKTQLEIPASSSGPSVQVAQIEAVEDSIHRLNQERGVLHTRRKRVLEQLVTPSHAKTWRELGADARVQDALMLSDILDERLETVDARLLELDLELKRLGRELDRLRLDAASAPTDQLVDDGRASWAVRVHVGGEGALKLVQLQYIVKAARWWPLYTLHIEQGGKRIRHIVEAMIAQDTGEDWRQVPIALSTASLLYDATLPELAALRLGKAQPAKPSGYRPPPQGLGRLFVSYDEATSKLGFRPPSPPPSPVESLFGQYTKQLALQRKGEERDREQLLDHALQEDYDEDEVMERAVPAPSYDDFLRAEAMLPPASKSSGFSFPSFGGGGPVGAPAPMAPGAPLSAAKPQPMKERARMSADIPQPQSVARGGFSRADGGGAPAAFHDEPVDEQISPQDQWLDFDLLVLQGPGAASSQRGKLKVGAQHAAPAISLNDAQLAAAKLNVTDPELARGHYDYRYEAQARVEIPSDGRLHRIEVMIAHGDVEQWWRAVPNQEEAVYRMARIKNPHPMPLLKGPMDVFVEGSFLLSTVCENIDRGGEVEVGLGVDDRFKVARNATMDEAKEGFIIQNKTSIVHQVKTELRSNVGFDAKIEILDRVPVTNSKDIEVELTRSEPAHQEYDQSADGAKTVRGGMRWMLTVGPGQRANVEFDYTITLSAKEELVGGNRRE